MSKEFAKLRGLIIEKYGTCDKFAEDLGITSVSLSNKMNGKTSFTMRDIKISQRLLDIDSKDVGEFFYTAKL